MCLTAVVRGRALGLLVLASGAASALEPTHFVFSGGGSKGDLYPGVYEGIEESKWLDGSVAFAGSSAGALAAVAFAFGSGPDRTKAFVASTPVTLWNMDFDKLYGEVTDIIRRTIVANFDPSSGRCAIKGVTESDKNKVQIILNRLRAGDFIVTFEDLQLFRGVCPTVFKELVVTATSAGTPKSPRGLAIFRSGSQPSHEGAEVSSAAVASANFAPAVPVALSDMRPVQFAETIDAAKATELLSDKSGNPQEFALEMFDMSPACVAQDAKSDDCSFSYRGAAYEGKLDTKNAVALDVARNVLDRPAVWVRKMFLDETSRREKNSPLVRNLVGYLDGGFMDNIPVDKFGGSVPMDEVMVFAFSTPGTTSLTYQAMQRDPKKYSMSASAYAVNLEVSHLIRSATWMADYDNWSQTKQDLDDVHKYRANTAVLATNLGTADGAMTSAQLRLYSLQGYLEFMQFRLERNSLADPEREVVLFKLFLFNMFDHTLSLKIPSGFAPGKQVVMAQGFSELLLADNKSLSERFPGGILAGLAQESMRIFFAQKSGGSDQYYLGAMCRVLLSSTLTTGSLDGTARAYKGERASRGLSGSNTRYDLQWPAEPVDGTEGFADILRGAAQKVLSEKADKPANCSI